MKRGLLLLVVVMVLGLSGPVSATLWDRGGGLIYDDHLNITWLQNANYANGQMIWSTATTWAANLTYYDSVRNVTYDDWRLPTTVDGPNVPGFKGTTTGGYNITSSEMGYMYYINLANKGYFDTDGNGPQPGYSVTPNATFTDGSGNVVSFQNLQSSVYWSGTANSSTNYAWYFNFRLGSQGTGGKTTNYYAWAVRPGDVSAVPEPTTMLLLGLGLIGLAGVRRKFQK